MERLNGIMMNPSHAEMDNVSRVIHKGPCLVTGFTVTADGAAAEADLYDGQNASGRHVAKIMALDGTTFEWHLQHPVDFDKGIYVHVNADTTYVMVCYIPESWKDYI